MSRFMAWVCDSTRVRGRSFRPASAVVVLALFALAAGGLGACGGGSSSADAIVGEILLEQPDQLWHDGDECTGAGEYAGVKEGADVVVTDQTGKVIASDELGTGHAEAQSGLTGSEAHLCEFTFRIEVPVAESYTVEIPHGDKHTYSRSLLESNFWAIGFDLGASPSPSPAP
jgi:hypothetical protein